jgi:hypothetical protein
VQPRNLVAALTTLLWLPISLRIVTTAFIASQYGYALSNIRPTACILSETHDFRLYYAMLGVL